MATPDLDHVLAMQAQLNKLSAKIDGRLRDALFCAEARQVKIEALERARKAMGRKILFMKNFPGPAAQAYRIFDQHYRDSWTHERWKEFCRQYTKSYAATRCPARCGLNGRQCALNLGHAGWYHTSEGCSWTNKDNL